MRKDQEAYIRDVRAKVAAAIQHNISQMEPLVEADLRGKKWSSVDRFDAVEAVDEMMDVVAMAGKHLATLKRKGVMKKTEQERLYKVTLAFQTAVKLANEMTVQRMVSWDEKRAKALEKRARARAERKKEELVPPDGQAWFMVLYRSLMKALRRSLAAMFYLTNDAKLKAVHLSKKDTDDLRYGSAGVQAAVMANYEHKAHQLADKTGQFVEVFAYDGELLYDISPHPATVRKELGVVARKEKRAYPFVANAAVKDYNVLADLYEWDFLK